MAENFIDHHRNGVFLPEYEPQADSLPVGSIQSCNTIPVPAGNEAAASSSSAQPQFQQTRQMIQDYPQLIPFFQQSEPNLNPLSFLSLPPFQNPKGFARMWNKSCLGSGQSGTPASDRSATSGGIASAKPTGIIQNAPLTAYKTLIPISLPDKEAVEWDASLDDEIGKAVANYLGRHKVDLKDLEEPSSEPDIVHVMRIRNYSTDVAVSKKLKDKLNCLVKENASNWQDRLQLRRDLLNCIKIKKHRKQLPRITKLKHCCGELKTVWVSRGLPAEVKSLRSAAASKDVFDLSSLNKYLPSRSGDNHLKRKAEKLAKKYISFLEKTKHSFRRSEILRILASMDPEQNNNSSSSSKHHHFKSITRMVKKVYGDVKNVRILSFRPLLKKGSNSCMEIVRGFNNETNENKSLMSEKYHYKFGKEIIVLVKSPCTKTDETRSEQPKDENTSLLNPNIANDLQNPERFIFNRHQLDDEHRNVSLQIQQFRDSISLSRQMSRLKITNSRRAGLSEDISVSEIQKVSTYQNEEEQRKVALALRRKKFMDLLKEKISKPLPKWIGNPAEELMKPVQRCDLWSKS